MSVASITEQSGRTVVALEGEIDMEEAPKVRRTLLDSLKQKRDILVDLSQVTYIDSSGIASLIEGLLPDPGQAATHFLGGEARVLIGLEEGHYLRRGRSVPVREGRLRDGLAHPAGRITGTTRRSLPRPGPTERRCARCAAADRSP